MGKRLSVPAVAAAGLCLLLMAVRIAGSMSVAEPLHLQTSGDEIASLFAVWEKARGLDVFTDRFKIPFNGIFFNWLFYEAYGRVVRLIGAPDPWLPTVARLFTLLGAVTVTAAAYASFAGLCRRPGWRTIALAFAVVVGLGPLMGYWAITVRPDAWAFAAEVTGAALFLRLWPRHPNWAVLAVCLFGYIAWGFKQIDLFLLIATGLFLLLRRDWRRMALLVAVMAAAWATTVAAGSPGYGRALFFAHVPLTFLVSNVERNLLNMLVKSGPMLAAAGVVMVLLRQRLLGRDEMVFALCGLAASLLAVPINAQSGASENYFFALSYFLTLTALVGLSGLATLPSWAEAVMAGGWLSLAGAVGVVLTGLQGITDLHPQHRTNTALKLCTDRLPRPLFTDTPYLMLPWMTPGTTPFVLSFVYATERGQGKPFEADGIGGLARSGYFSALVVGGDELDGAALDGYAAADLCPGITVRIRK